MIDYNIMIAGGIIFQTHQKLRFLLKKESKLMHFWKRAFLAGKPGVNRGLMTTANIKNSSFSSTLSRASIQGLAGNS